MQNFVDSVDPFTSFSPAMVRMSPPRYTVSILVSAALPRHWAQSYQTSVKIVGHSTMIPWQMICTAFTYTV